jgi:carbon starvation protein
LGVEYRLATDAQGEPLHGRAAWESRYNPHAEKAWHKFELKEPVGAFVEGGANFLASLGIPVKLGVPLVAVLVACFAATTMDTATRLQRYVIQELSASLKLRPFVNPYIATGLAVTLAALMALVPANEQLGPGSGGKLLWPLFGATNQLLAGLAFLVTVFYLRRRNCPVFFILPPLALMIVMPAWAMLYQMFHPQTGWWVTGRYLLFGGSAAILALQFWMVAEAVLLWSRVKGVLEAPLPPLPAVASK